MEQTERLYFTDSNLLEFSAKVLSVRATESGGQVVLDRTAFYPTGGGQPNDTGKLGDQEVFDVLEDEGGVIYHVIRDATGISPGDTISGQVDRARRLDHLQQHSGQHILSQAFLRACGAETRSFHLGSETSTIDIELQSPGDDDMRRAEEIANGVIFDNRPMHVHLVDEQQAAEIPLRKESAVRGTIRVIEIEDFDWSPCGGTHATRAGQVGLIAIKSYERAKRMTRVEFVCGHRALEEYRLANTAAVAVAKMFSAERDSAAEMVRLALQENRSLKKRVRDLLNLAMSAEAARLLAGVPETAGYKVVEGVFEARELEEIRILASKIVELEPSVALLGTKDVGAARLVFARSANLPHNIGQLLAEACQVLGGRGGGKPDLAQGGGPATEKMEEAIKLAAERVRRQ